MDSLEEWRSVDSYRGYEVSSHGRVRSWLPKRNNAPMPVEPRLLKLGTDKDGYRKATLFSNGKRTDFRVAVLVAAQWYGPRPTGMFVLHRDGSKNNDTPKNLRWGFPIENSADAIKHGTLVRGSSVNTSKLTEQDVIEVLSSSLGHSELARKFGVTPSAIWHIRDGRTWKHVSR